MNIIEELEEKALASRIKSLSDLLMADMLRIYKEQDYDFEPRWFSLFQLVLKRKKISITEIAKELNQTHPAVVQVVNALEKKKLIMSSKDIKDSRKRLISLSTKGFKLATNLAPLWEDVYSAANEMLEESAPDFLRQIKKVENAIASKSMYDRIKEKNHQRTIENAEFVPFRLDFQSAFQSLNYDWLTEYLEITDHDTKIISDPQKEIIAKNGAVYLLVSGSKILGCYALQKTSNTECELSKFTIKKEYRGYKLGIRMLNHAIQAAKQMSFQSIILFTHEKLFEATNLYQNNGFKIIKDAPTIHDKTGRCSIFMQLNIN